jgi:hypothetical protein
MVEAFVLRYKQHSTCLRSAYSTNGNAFIISYVCGPNAFALKTRFNHNDY